MSRNTQAGVTLAGLNFWSLLGITLIILKLCDVITWSWWWVLAPLWGPPAAVVSFLIFVALVAGLGALVVSVIDYYQSRR